MAILKEDLFLWAQRGKSSSWRDGSILPEGSQSKHRICFILPARRLIIPSSALILPACRRLLFPLLHAEKVPFPRAPKEIGDVCTQAIRSPAKRGSTEFEPRGNWVRFSERTFPANYTTVFLMCFEVKYRVVDGFSSRRNQQKK